MNKDEVDLPPVRVIAGVSPQKGVEHIAFVDTAITHEHIMAFLSHLHQLHHNIRIAVYWDNVNIHKATNVGTLCGQLDIRLVWNIPYYPDTNPVEACFSNVKGYYRRKRLEALVNNAPFANKQVVREAFDRITPEHVQNCENRSMKILMETNFIYE